MRMPIFNSTICVLSEIFAGIYVQERKNKEGIIVEKNIAIVCSSCPSSS